MRVLCPVDFSEASINAAKWIASLLNNIEGAELQLSHYIYVLRRAGIFLTVTDIFFNRAKEDMEVLEQSIRKECPDLKLETSIFSAHPKEAIVHFAKEEGFDLIVTGSTGLTALKDMTIGSVTEYVMKRTQTPVLVIPEAARFQGLDKIALAVDDEIIERLSSFYVLRDLCIQTNATLNLIHIHEEDESPFEYDPGIDLFFRDLQFDYRRLELEKSIPHTMNTYCHSSNVDLLCMVHHKRNWLEKLFQKSITRAELFKLEIPLLILPEL